MMRMRRLKIFFQKNPLAVVGFFISSIAVFLAILGPHIGPYPPEEATIDILERPSRSHLFGTDISGFDVFTRVIAAPRVDLSIGVGAALISLLLGSPFGIIAGYSRGIIGEVISRISDIIQSFPVFILAMVIVAIRGPSIINVIFVVAFLNSPIYLRLLRSHTLQLRERAFIEAARSVGNSDIRIVFRHLLPNSITIALIQLPVTIGWAVLLTSSLSFIGAGVRPPVAEWGAMIAVGAQNMITGEWWPSLFPGVALGTTVFGFASVGNYLEQKFGRT
jgi:peptide/nickel transport system permease protein